MTNGSLMNQHLAIIGYKKPIFGLFESGHSYTGFTVFEILNIYINSASQKPFLPNFPSNELWFTLAQ